MRVKLVVGELNKLNRYRPGKMRHDGFYSFMLSLKYRVDDDTGEIDLDRDDFARLKRYARTGYKKRTLDIFGRTLGGLL
jgi:hypothetical protein